MNVVLLQGTLSRDPEERILASGDRLVTYEVTTREEGRRAATVPVVWADPPASADRLVQGSEVVVTGEVSRRFFRSGGATASRTEVIADKVLAASQRRAVVAAFARMRERVDLPGSGRAR